MDAKALIDVVKKELEDKGFKATSENQAFIETIIESIIAHIQSQAIVQVTTTGTATTQSGVGKIM